MRLETSRKRQRKDLGKEGVGSGTKKDKMKRLTVRKAEK
jgi:hypothetical protein